MTNVPTNNQEMNLKNEIQEKKIGAIFRYFLVQPKKLIFFFPPFFLCQAIEVAETHFIFSNPHHPSAAFSQKVNTPAVSARKDRDKNK